MTVTAAACSCVNVELCTGKDPCSVNVLPDDEVRALTEYFQGSYHNSIDISRVRIVNIKVDCTISTSERATSTTTAVVNPIRLKACDLCESKLVSCKPVPATSRKHEISSLGTFAKSSGPSIDSAANVDVQKPGIYKFSDLLKSLFLSDSHGRCTITLAVKADITGNALLNSGDINENTGQLSTPGSCFSPLSQSVAPVGRMKFGSSEVQTELRASLFPAGISVGLLHLDAPLFPCDDVSTVIDNQGWGISLDDDINQNSSLKDLPEAPRRNGILERTNKKRKNINLNSETLSLQSPSKSTPSEWIGTARPSGRRFQSELQSLGSRGFSGTRYSESADTENTNRTGNSRASKTTVSAEGSGSGYLKEREKNQRRGSSRGHQNSTSANIEKEKSSKRSQDTADKLFTILNGRGNDRKSSRLSLGVAACVVPPKSGRRIDMKSMLRESSAGAFEGLQLETVDPDFVFPGGVKDKLPPSSCNSISTGVISTAGDRKMYTSSSINTTTSTPLITAAITKRNLDLMKLPETDTDSIATASTVLLSTANTEELLYWKGQSNNDSVDQSCPSTPSTVEDIQLGVDRGSELSTFAETYKRSSHLYEVMPQDDGSLFTGLPVTFGKGEFSALAPPEESLAYSACSPSDTRTPDLLSPQGVAFFTRKLSGSKKTTSLFGSMVSTFSSTVSSTFGIFSAVTNANPNTNTAAAAAATATATAIATAKSESTNSALTSLVANSTSAPVITQIPVSVLGLPVSTSKSLEVKEEVLRDAEILPEKCTVASVSMETSGISLRSLQDLKCDPSLLSALSGLSKLKQDIVAVILDCVVNRKIYVLDAAVAVNEILKSNSRKKTSNKKKIGKKTDANLVCQILEKITKKPLGGNLAVAQAVSSCCVLLVYILLEIEWEKVEKSHTDIMKKDIAKMKENKAEEKALKESVNDLIVSSFDRLAVATLSPFLGYDDVNWLTISDTSGGKKSITDVTTQPAPDPVENTLLSPRLRKRKAGALSNSLSDSPNSASRGLKKKRSLTEKNTPGGTPSRSKRDCLWEVVSALKVRYQRASAVSSAFRRLTRNFRPVAGVAGEISESDSSPLKSPGVNSPTGTDAKSDVRGKENAPPDRFLELLSMNSRANGLRRAATFSGRTLPMIPLSVAGTALLFSAPLESQVQGPQPPVESVMSVTSKDLSVGTSKGSGTGHSFKRTNSIVNVHKPSVGQRTGRGKGKSVRTSLKPDPNINSILSFTVPNGSSLGSRKGSPGSKADRGQVKVNTSNAVEREKAHIDRSDKRNPSLNSSTSLAMTNRSKVSVPNSDVISSGGSVRRSARKRAREDGDSWRNPPTPLTCDVNEVEDTPIHKVRVRKGSASLLASGMRVLRGTSPAVKGNVVRRPSDLHTRPAVDRDNTHTQESHSSQESSHRKGVMGAGIADSFASAVFGSGSSRRNSTRRRVSIPFFLPDMSSEKDDYGVEVQTHSAGAALGMENTEGGSATKRRSPRFTSRQNTTVIASTAGNATVEVELDRELLSNASTGSFSRNAFARSDYAPDSSKKALQRRHSSAPMPSSPAPSFHLSMISTPPVQYISKARMGSPVVHRSMADMHTRRTSPRRHYSPV